MSEYVPVAIKDEDICECGHTGGQHDVDLQCAAVSCVCGMFRFSADDEVVLPVVPVRATVETIIERVIHPSHYQSKSGIEVWDITDAFDLNFNLGNALKYLLRADKKGSPIEDLKKAANYINHEIEWRDAREEPKA